MFVMSPRTTEEAVLAMIHGFSLLTELYHGLRKGRSVLGLGNSVSKSWKKERNAGHFDKNSEFTEKNSLSTRKLHHREPIHH
jgi:hypothetical protein